MMAAVHTQLAAWVIKLQKFELHGMLRLSDEHVDIFYRWVLEHASEGCKILDLSQEELGREDGELNDSVD
jgi:hypothetical protein